jgi:putative membrane protein
MKRRYSLVLIGLALSAFFPAYLWYQPEHAWVGYLFTIAFALASYIPWIKHNKAWRVALWLVALWGIIIETIGITTCIPYGCFSYSEQLWPKILWWAPRLLLVTYPPLVLWVYQYIKRLNLSWPLLRIAWWFWLMLVDLILDPIAVQMWLRSYTWGWFWFGVPLSNFLGWIISGTIATLLIDKTLNKTYNPNSNYRRWLWLNLTFFVWYMIWKFIINY